MSQIQTDRNLLLGILALQNNLVSREVLLAAFTVWVADKSKSLGELFVEQGKLTSAHHELLEALVKVHIEQHHGSPVESLRALSSIESMRQDLERLRDPDLQATLMHVSAGRKESQAGSAADPYSTIDVSVGQATSKGLRFRILRPHAEGGLGMVSVARDEELNREVALKEIRPHYADHEDSRARFLREAEITGGLEHPCIVPVYGLGQYADGRPFYAMRFIKGDSLKEAIDRFHAGGEGQRDKVAEGQRGRGTEGQREGAAAFQSLELRKLLQRFIDVCEAIEYAHSRGVLHRDLKPGNIMLGKYGETLVVDWGLAKPLVDTAPAETDATLPRGSELPLNPRSGDSAEPTMHGAALGTPAFMPPEQAQGRLDLLGPASDVYSLGATLYSLLTGRPPVAGASTAEVLKKVQDGTIPRPRSLNPQIPAALEAICLKAMALRPEHRYKSARLLAADVEKWLADEPVTAFPEPARLRAARWVRRHQAATTGIGAALAVCLLAAVIVAGVAGSFNQSLAKKNTEIVAKSEALEESNDDLAAAREDTEKQKNEAIAARETALQSAREERRQRFEANLEQARSHYERAFLLRERGEHASYYLWLAKTLEELESLGEQLSPTETPEFRERLASLLRSTELAIISHIEQVPVPLVSLSHGNGIDSAVTQVAFSPDRSQMATGSNDKTVRLWDPMTGRPIDEPIQHPEPIRTLVFGPDGSNLAIAGNSTVRLWNTFTGKPLGEPIAQPGGIRTVTFSGDGKRIAIDTPSAARVWATDTGKPIGETLPHESLVASNWGVTLKQIAFSTDLARAVLRDKKGMTLWDSVTGKQVGDVLYRHRLEFAMSPRGDVVAGATIGGVGRWDAMTGMPIGEPLKQSGVYRILFSPNGMLIATVAHGPKLSLFDKSVHKSLSDEVRLWETGTGNAVGNPIGHDSLVTAMAFSPNGERIATATSNGTAQVWKTAHFFGGESEQVGTRVGKPMTHQQTITSLVFSANGERIITSSKDGVVRIWEVATGRPLSNPVCHRGAVSAVECNRDASRLVTVCEDGTARLWDTSSPTDQCMILSHRDRITSSRFSHDGTKVVSTSGDESARLWDAKTGRLLGKLSHDAWVQSAAFLPDDSKLLTATNTGTVQLWDISTLGRIGTPKEFDSDPCLAEFTPSGSKVAIVRTDRSFDLFDTVTGKGILMGDEKENSQWLSFSPEESTMVSDNSIWDVATGERLHELPFIPIRLQEIETMIMVTKSQGTRTVTGMTSSVRTGDEQPITFSRDGARLVTGTADNKVQVLEARSGKALGEGLEHHARLLSLAISSDGRFLATGCADRTARVWNLTTQLPVSPPLGHDDEVWSVAFSPDSAILLTASKDNSVRIWDASTGQPLCEPLPHLAEIKWLVVSPSGTRMLTFSGDQEFVRLWQLPSSKLGASASHVRTWLEFITGQRLDATGAIELLSREEISAAYRKLSAMGGTPSAVQDILDARRERSRHGSEGIKYAEPVSDQ